MKLRSQHTRKAGKPWKHWDVHVRLAPDLKEPVLALAKERGSTLADEVELAIRAHLKVPIPEPEPPKALTAMEQAICRMRYHNQQSIASLAREYGVSEDKMRSVVQ